MAATSAIATGRSRQFVLGIANGDVPTDPDGFSAELATSWRERGMGCIAVGFARPAAGISEGQLRDTRSLLADAGISVSEFAGVNANLVHPDADVRTDAVRRVQDAVGPAAALGARYINSGPGSCSPNWRESFYCPDPENFTAAAEDRAVSTLTRIAQVIDGADVGYTIECHQLTTMRSAEIIRRVLDRVDHPRVLANFDPINLLDSAYAAFTNADRIPELVATVGPRYAQTCHVKDVVVTDAMPYESHEAPPGTGLVAVETILAAAAELPGDGPVELIVEHLDPRNAARSVQFVRERATAAGISFCSLVAPA